MARARIRYHQAFLDPYKTNDREIVAELDYPDGARVEIVGADYIGGGSEARYMLHIIVIEPSDVEA